MVTKFREKWFLGGDQKNVTSFFIGTHTYHYKISESESPSILDKSSDYITPTKIVTALTNRT
jgi:hypothetical protein